MLSNVLEFVIGKSSKAPKPDPFSGLFLLYFFVSSSVLIGRDGTIIFVPPVPIPDVTGFKVKRQKEGQKEEILTEIL